jgi:cytidylate kinase
MPNSIEQLIQRQISQWNSYKQLLRKSPEPKKVKLKPIFTISRQLGSGARVLADALAQRFDLMVHGVSLIDVIAQDSNVQREVIDAMDEQCRSEIEGWVDGMIRQQWVMKDDYHVSLVRAVRMIASAGGVVMLGRGANIILADTATLRIRVVAPEPERVKNLMRYKNMTEAEALDSIHDFDERRSNFIKELFNVDPDDPLLYDLVINTSGIKPEKLLDVVIAAVGGEDTVA